MTSQRKKEANRLNALKSTGPGNTENTCNNALWHGGYAKCVVLPHENLGAFRAMVFDYVFSMNIRTPQEFMLANMICMRYWQLMRCVRLLTDCQSEAPLRDELLKDMTILTEQIDRHERAIRRLDRQLTRDQQLWMTPEEFRQRALRQTEWINTVMASFHDGELEEGAPHCYYRESTVELGVHHYAKRAVQEYIRQENDYRGGDAFDYHVRKLADIELGNQDLPEESPQPEPLHPLEPMRQEIPEPLQPKQPEPSPTEEPRKHPETDLPEPEEDDPPPKR